MTVEAIILSNQGPFWDCFSTSFLYIKKHVEKRFQRGNTIPLLQGTSFLRWSLRCHIIVYCRHNDTCQVQLLRFWRAWKAIELFLNPPVKSRERGARFGLHLDCCDVYSSLDPSLMTWSSQNAKLLSNQIQESWSSLPWLMSSNIPSSPFLLHFFKKSHRTGIKQWPVASNSTTGSNKNTPTKQSVHDPWSGALDCH